MKTNHFLLIIFLFLSNNLRADFKTYDSTVKPKFSLEKAIEVSKKYLDKISNIDDSNNIYYVVNASVGKVDGSSWYVTFGSEKFGKYTFHIDYNDEENWTRYYPHGKKLELLPEVQKLPQWREKNQDSQDIPALK